MYEILTKSDSLIWINPGCLWYVNDPEILDLVTSNTFTENRKMLSESYSELEWAEPSLSTDSGVNAGQS